MRVLIAPDKFKGSLTAAEVADHLAKGLAEAGAHSRTLPLADGGDGSVAAALAAGFHSLPVDVHGATGETPPRPRRLQRRHRHRRSRQHLRTGHPARRGPRTDDRVELRLRRSHPRRADACPRRAWCSRSAAAPAPTAASACSPRWATASSTAPAISWPPPPRTWTASTASTLSHAVDLTGIELIVAGDVTSPLLGLTGAAAVFGPQKGATAAQVAQLDAGLRQPRRAPSPVRVSSPPRPAPTPPAPAPPAASASPPCSWAPPPPPARSTSWTC